MSKDITIGQLLINDALPEDLRDYSRVLDKGGLKELFQQVAERYPDQYRDISQKFNKLGIDFSYRSGGNSFGLKHLRVAESAKKIRSEVSQEINRILGSKGTPEQKSQAITLAVGRLAKRQQQEIFDESKAEGNPLAHQIISGARGNPANLSSLRGSDMQYVDHRGEIIPIPVLRSYSEGLSPAEYWAGAYGARQGIYATKYATAAAGFLGKQLNQANHRLVVVGEDEEDPELQKTSNDRGLPVDVDDMDSVGALLARPVGGYNRNQVITPKILADLKRRKIDQIVVRSPITSTGVEGGVYARDIGVREFNRLPNRGEFVGMTAAQAESEKLLQGQLCLAGDTLVRMADFSVKRIREIVVGDQVMGSDKSGRLSPVKVLNIFDNGEKDCVRTEFRSAKTQQFVHLDSTPDHKVLAKTRHWALPSERKEYGIFPVSKKCVGFSAKMPACVNYESGEPEPFADLCGLLLGDGCYTEAVQSVNWSCYEPGLVKEMQPYLQTLGLKATKLKGHEGYYKLSQIADKAERDPRTGQFLPGDRNPALIWLKSKNMYGKYAHEKAIPEEVWEWDQESVSRMLGCLFATDGSVYESKDRPGIKYVGFGSTSETLTQQVKLLLEVRFGVFSSGIDTQKGKRKRPIHTFAITRSEQVRRFEKAIRIPYRKGRMLADYVKTLQEDDSAEYFHKRGQVSIGRLPTFDIEVDHPDHLFVLANGLIVSNSSKHSGGVAGEEKAVGGFDYINQLIQIPRVFKGGATHAGGDGKVRQIVKAPAGGHHVYVDDESHYVPEGVKLKVSVGDEVEAGDMLSEGIPNPAKIVEHKGLGEGRRYLTYALKDAYSGAGLKSDRRNLEMLSRGLINHVVVDKNIKDYVPGDIIPYSEVERDYRPRKGHVSGNPAKLKNYYLESPALHYTIGTRLTPSVQKNLSKFGINSVTAHENPPPFRAAMVRGMYNLKYDPDWVTQMFGSGLKGSLLNSVHRGRVSDTDSTSFVPSLAKGVDFGKSKYITAPSTGTDYELPSVEGVKAAAIIDDEIQNIFGSKEASRTSGPTSPIKPIQSFTDRIRSNQAATGDTFNNHPLSKIKDPPVATPKPTAAQPWNYGDILSKGVGIYEDYVEPPSDAYSVLSLGNLPSYGAQTLIGGGINGALLASGAITLDGMEQDRNRRLQKYFGNSSPSNYAGRALIGLADPGTNPYLLYKATKDLYQTSQNNRQMTPKLDKQVRQNYVNQTDAMAPIIRMNRATPGMINDYNTLRQRIAPPGYTVPPVPQPNPTAVQGR